MVESEDEIKSIGDYKPSAGGTGKAEDKAGKEAPPAPKKEVSPPPPPPPPPSSEEAASKPSQAPVHSSAGGDQIFATPAAKKLAEGKHVCNLNLWILWVCGTCHCHTIIVVLMESGIDQV
jgi:pyruvate/2-oxoglutarate dehydrogenase complex dihydrolipoamide acyltransferase (E2) component